MAYVATAPTEYLADELAKVIGKNQRKLSYSEIPNNCF